MEQFSHDLTIALEETSRIGNLHSGRWGLRRRTRSTGNLPSAPQPTEDSSSSPADAPTKRHEFGAAATGDALSNTFLSDSDDHSELKLLIKSRDVGNFESDSLNENFSPARPNTRRKRKFKRMAVEYETTPTTPGTSTVSPLFPGAIKKRVLRHACQENFRANLYFCGKRKRSHRDRYAEYEHKQHSSSVPRQRDVFIPRYSYLEFKSRSRQLAGRPFEKIQPLNKNIVSKIEKISQESAATSTVVTMTSLPEAGGIHSRIGGSLVVEPAATEDEDTMKSGDFRVETDVGAFPPPQHAMPIEPAPLPQGRRGRKKEYMKMQLQFDDPNFMDCSLSEFLSSSSLSSSDSEAAATNESDHEGDDELTDWPGNEVMINFASKNDFKRARPPKLTKTRSNHETRDPDTDMMNVDGAQPVPHLTGHMLLGGKAPVSTQPINIAGGSSYSSGGGGGGAGGCPEIESEMSGETSNHFLSSPNTLSDVREIRAGCRRIREERPGFSIITSVNEDLSRFLQDGQQMELRLPESNVKEHEKLSHLAKLYSLNMQLNDGCAILTKTSNTTQTVRIDRSSMSKRLLLSDHKRRCYGGDTEDVDLEEMPS
ncbi:uncharacterized protein LOC129796395 [Lutzomyia longipalpis]|uniref:uncharacterized protein LOC129796395 n=1 Tax=Lutzomyia longipalpis TaxID=7200 RepID=UPI00248405B3|nr:uncharacterized protein LOC129796395 [Lutzomyia longipalpis]XP_055694275.1 uncharacterized protein LOC129796395 [Lutzomyia longipalpis]